MKLWGVNMPGYGGFGFFARIFTLSLILFAFVVVHPLDSESQRRKKRRLVKRLLKSNIERIADDSYALDLPKEFSTFLKTSIDPELYNPLSMLTLERARDRAQPWWDNYEIDPKRSKGVVRKAFTIKAAETVIPAIKRSEFGEFYEEIERGFRNITGLVSFSLQDTGQNYTVSRSKVGSKLVEFNLKISPSNGMDPEMAFGESFRLRYDPVDKEAFFECGITF